MSSLAASYVALGESDKAADVLKSLIATGQANGDAFYTLGKVKLATGRFEEALNAFDSAQQRDGVTAKISSGRAISLAAMGKPLDAIRAFGGNSDRLTLSNKALVFAAIGRAEAAVLMLEPLVQSGQSSSRDRQNLAMAYLLNGQEKEAYAIARVDLDPATINETFTFYRSLESLKPVHRMQALATGAVNPAWTRTEMANLELQESSERSSAAERIVDTAIAARTEPEIMVAEAPKPAPEPMPEPTPEPEPVSRADYVLTEVPPLVEPEGWALQIGAYRTIKNLMRGWTILYRQSGDLLEGIPPRRSEVDFGEREGEPSGFYYRLNAGPLKSLKQARMLCKELRERGTSCWIRPPEVTEGNLPKEQSAEDRSQNEAVIVADAAVMAQN
jgi:tetratricopeptide (TPR) repeat protein